MFLVLQLNTVGIRKLNIKNGCFVVRLYHLKTGPLGILTTFDLYKTGRVIVMNVVQAMA